MGALDVLDASDVYWAGRLTLCSGPDDLARYDAAFAAWFGGERPRARATRPPPRPVVSAMAPLDAGAGDGAEPGAAGARRPGQRRGGAAAPRRRRARPGGAASTCAGCSPCCGRPRRCAARGAGGRARPARSTPRRTVRRALRDGGEVTRLLHRRAAPRPRRVVLLIDVSGSMSPYADALLRFAHAAVRSRPASTEVFTSAPG